MDDDDEGDDDYSAAVIDIGMDTVKVPSIPYNIYYERAQIQAQLQWF